MIHHKLSTPKKPVIDLTDESWMIQDSTSAKKNTAHQAIGQSSEISMSVTEVVEVEEERLEEVMEDIKERTEEQKVGVKKKARKAKKKKGTKATAKVEQKKEVKEAEIVEYTKGLLRSKMLGVAPREDIHQAITDIFQERVLEEVLYEENWKVVEKKERAKRVWLRWRRKWLRRRK